MSQAPTTEMAALAARVLLRWIDNRAVFDNQEELEAHFLMQNQDKPMREGMERLAKLHTNQNIRVDQEPQPEVEKINATDAK